MYHELNLVNDKLQNYLKLKLPINLLGLIAQIRLLKIYCTILIINATLYKLNDSHNCNYCNKQDTFLHSIIDCQFFLNKRLSLCLPCNSEQKLDIFKILENPNL